MLGAIASHYVEASGSAAYFDEVMWDAPLAYWRQGEASGTTMVDSSGNGRDGTYTAGVVLGQTGLLVGDADTCADYPGTDWGHVTHGAWMNGHTGITAEALVKPDEVSSSRMIVGKTSSNWQLYIVDGKLAMNIWWGGGNGFGLTGATTLVAGTTYHVAFTAVESGAVVLYLNGVADASGTLSGDFYETSEAIRVGADSGGGAIFNGLIDEAAFYGSALSAGRISTHYEAATT